MARFGILSPAVVSVGTSSGPGVGIGSSSNSNITSSDGAMSFLLWSLGARFTGMAGGTSVGA